MTRDYGTQIVRLSAIERAALGILTAVLTASLCGIGWAILDVRERVARIEGRLERAP